MMREHSQALMERAAAMVRAGRPGAARPLLAALREAEPDSAHLPALSARVALLEGDLAAARATLDAGIAAAPADVELRKLRADVAQRADDLRTALADAAECVILDSGDAAAKALLGTLLLRVGQVADALTCLDEACAGESVPPGYYVAWAAAQEASGAADRAASTLERARTRHPTHAAIGIAAMLQALRRDDAARAIAIGEAMREAGCTDARVFGLLGHARSVAGEHAAASRDYQEALTLGPDDPYVRHLVAASGHLPATARAHPEYVRAVFEGYAERFDAHLIALGYRVPGLFRQMLQRLRPDGAPGAVLDLGCGTGLALLTVADLLDGPVVGVDLAPAMLDIARRRGLYAELHTRDLSDFLAEESRRFTLILAADVFCYFGDLAPVLRAIAARLTPGGLLLLSLEAATQATAPWHLQPRGRYAHHPDHLRAAAAAAGLALVELTQEPLRQEAGAPVPGLLAALTPIS
jgi:predicted TPR repeat methyltransferase